MRLLARFRPVEPYSFGTDQGFVYGNEERTGKESYFVTSWRVPSQTTILGTLRYLLLSWDGLLSTTFDYDRGTRERMAGLIGPRSFSFFPDARYLDQEGCQSFGAIQSVSPLFLMRGADLDSPHVLVPNPFNNKAKVGEVYTSLGLGESITCSEGLVRLPAEGEYDPKVGHGRGLIDAGDRTVVADPFSSMFVPGVSKDRRAGDSDSFFMRELVTLQEGLAFAVTVDLDDEVAGHLVGSGRRDLVRMGKKGSAFEVTVSPSSFDIAHTVEKSFAGCSGSRWTMALSDLWMTEDWRPRDYFFIVEERGQRALTTHYGASTAMGRVRKGLTRNHLIAAGSVFAGDPELPLDKNAQRIGYNTIVTLGADA